MDVDDLHRQIHVIASKYHWSEKEILNLTRKKRNAYLQIIENQNE